MDKVAVAKPGAVPFAGTAAEQDLAARIHEYMVRQGLMFAVDKPITVPLERIVAGVSRHYPNLAATTLTTRIKAALAANPPVFAVQESEGRGLVVVTTKSGRHPYNDDDPRHMLRHRLNPEATAVSAQESRNMTDGWMASAQARTDNFTIFNMEPAAEAAVGPARPPARPGFTPPPYVPTPQVLPPVRPPTPLRPAELPPSVPPIREAPETLVAPPDYALITPEILAQIEAPVALPEIEEEEPLLPVVAGPAPVVIAPEPVVVPPAPVVAPPPVIAPPPPVPAAPARPIYYTLATLSGPQTIDLARPIDELVAEQGPALAAMLEQALREDFRFVSFGPDWFIEDQVERFSKGDFRRIKDYLIETQEALSDQAFMTDVLNRREADPDYQRLRFSLNYRMLKEKKDFEFVGVNSDRLWIVAGASPVSAPKRKPSELGVDYRHLEDPAIQGLEPGADDPAPPRWEHTLTYYEYENGLLPYNHIAKALFPQPLLEDQRAVLLRFEVPLLFQSFAVELRFPTGNRGGYLVGLDVFFQENLVPGAKFSIEPSDQADVYTLRFERTPAQEARLLHFDERRSRFVFQPTTYYVEVTPSALLSEERFPHLNNVKRMDETERKKSEAVVISAFELAGEHIDDSGRWWATLEDLLPVANLERPFSPGALRAILDAGHDYLYPDPDNAGSYFYDPAKKQ